MKENIYGVINISKETDNNEKNPMMTEEFQITLSSKVLFLDRHDNHAGPVAGHRWLGPDEVGQILELIQADL